MKIISTKERIILWSGNEREVVCFVSNCNLYLQTLLIAL